MADADSLSARALRMATPLFDTLPPAARGPLLDLLLRAGRMRDALPLAGPIARARPDDELV
ncbi:MAG: hypothetical protein MUE41_14835 [Gemmatimonadaceae bacterium]|nr:hypothetical protein [Gemmatimonadaceae bacterium]